MGFFDFFKKTDGTYEQGVKCLEAGNYPDAFICFKQVGSSSKNYGRALTHIVSSLIALGEYDEAIEWFNKIPKSTPCYDQAIADVIVAYTNTEQCEKAFASFTEIATSGPYYGVGIINYFSVLLNVDDPDKYRKEAEKAIINFTKLEKSDCLYAVSLEYLLKVLSEYNKFQELLAYSNAFLDIEEDNSLGLYFKGEALYELEKYDTAMLFLNKVQCDSDEFVNAMYVKALIHEKFGNDEEAQKCWEEVDRIEFSSASAVVIDKNASKEAVCNKCRASRKRLV